MEEINNELDAPILSKASQDLVIDSAKSHTDYVGFAERLYEISPELERKADKIFRVALNRLALREARKPHCPQGNEQIAEQIISHIQEASLLTVDELTKYVTRWSDDCWREIIVFRLLCVEIYGTISPNDPDYVRTTQNLLTAPEEKLFEIDNQIDEERGYST